MRLKTFMNRPLALACAATLAVLPLSHTTVAGGSDTIGSLPSADGGDGSQTFYVTGPRDLIHHVITDASGDGYYVPVDLPGEDIWVEFYGDFCVTFDELVLEAHPEVEIGLTAGFEGAGMLVLPEVGGLLSGRKLFVDVGLSMATPFARIRGLVQEGLVLHTAQAVTRHRAEIRYDSTYGEMRVCQQHR